MSVATHNALGLLSDNSQETWNFIYHIGIAARNPVFGVCKQQMQREACYHVNLVEQILIDFSLTVKALTLIFISGRCSASSSAKQEKSGSFYNLVKN